MVFYERSPLLSDVGLEFLFSPASLFDAIAISQVNIFAVSSDIIILK